MQKGIIIETPFPGRAQTIFEGDKVFYSDLTLAEYLAKNPTYKIVDSDEYEKLNAEYWTHPFTQISEDDYEEYLGCLPPIKWRDVAPGVNVFFCSEATSGHFHACYIHDRNTNTFWGGTMSVYSTNEEIISFYGSRKG